MSEYSDDYCEVFSEEWRTARKEHTCDACGEPISPGAKYHNTFTIFDGNPDTTKRCVRCETMFRHLQARMRKEPDPYEGSSEYCNPTLSCGHEYKDRWKEEPPPEIAALAFWLPSDGPPKVGEIKV